MCGYDGRERGEMIDREVCMRVVIFGDCCVLKKYNNGCRS